MEQNLFRVGGCYRQLNGIVVLLNPWEDNCKYGHAVEIDNGINRGQRLLTNGRRVLFLDEKSHEHDLIPGELHQVNGAWVAVEEKPRRVETLGELLNQALARGIGTSLKAPGQQDNGGGSGCITKHAEMLRKDAEGFARAKPFVKPAPPTATPTSHPPMEGLTRVSGFSHLLGAGGR